MNGTRQRLVTSASLKVLAQAGAPIFTAVGLTFEENLKPMGRLPADLDIVAAGTIACEGAAILALEKEIQLRERFAGFFVDSAKKLFDSASMPIIRDILKGQDTSGIAVRDGGIFAGLWELGTVGKVGLDINLKAVPIRQHTVEVCEFCNINPYMLLSGGCILLAVSEGEQNLLHSLHDLRGGIRAGGHDYAADHPGDRRQHHRQHACGQPEPRRAAPARRLWRGGSAPYPAVDPGAGRRGRRRGESRGAVRLPRV